METDEMETFWFFRLWFRRAYDSTYDSDFRFRLGHKSSDDSDYDSDSGAGENHGINTVYSQTNGFTEIASRWPKKVYFSIFRWL